MSAEPIDDGGAAFPFTEKYDSFGTIANPHERGQSYRADVAKECLAALVAGGDILNGLTYDDVADIAVRCADALIARLKGGPQ